MARNTKPVKTSHGTSAHAADKPSRAEIDTSELEERIERLEERIEASILGDDGLAELNKSLDRGIDKTPSGDPLKRAVRRSNIKRGSRKA